ncbi:MAG: DUF4179 domain-containing protein [Eubacteriales bacterium]|nr:DUF4179 domain-containing protein [Eubacteriales bacterium]
MKRRISDIMDGFRDGTVELESSTPLSSERIKELTMSKINQKKEKKGKRIGFRILVAAAAISLVTMTAFAAEAVLGSGDLFRSIFNNQLKKDKETVQQDDLDITVRETVSQGQIDVVNELGKDFQPVTQTSEGTTMTLSAAYADKNAIHLYFQAEAPEGTVLPDNIYYQFYDYNQDTGEDGFWDVLELAEDAPYEISGYQTYIEALQDDDPADNKKDFHVTITAQSGMEMRFNDGVSKLFHITGIYEQVLNVNGDEDGYERIAPGEFTFDIGLVNDAKMVELDVEGLTYGGHKTSTWTHEGPCIAPCQEVLTGETDPQTGLPIHSESWDYTVTAKSLTLTPLSADWKCEYTTSIKRIGQELNFCIVMKDGTSPMLYSGGGIHNEEECWSSGTMFFSTPIDLDEVDYILIGDTELNDTYKVYLP